MDNHDLLFSLLAVNNGFIEVAQLKELQQKAVGTAPLLDRLAQADLISAEERSTIEALARQHLKRHGESAQQAIQSMLTAGDKLPTLLPESLQTVSLPLFAATEQASRSEEEQAGQRPPASSESRNRFQKRQPHASGGLGQVSIAEDTQLNRSVALKEIQPQYVDDPDCRRRFMLEAEVTGSLEHPGVVPVYGMGFDEDGQPYYAMRFIEGESLREAIQRLANSDSGDGEKQERSRAVRRLLQRFVTVCNTMQYAHSRGVLHRDIKPDNIMLGPYGETLIVDWGLAKFLGTAGESGSEKAAAESGSDATRLGSAMGTPGFMSPEQALGWHDTLTPTSDVYSLGATLYYLAVGKPAFVRSDVKTMIRDAQTGNYPKPRAANSDVAKPLEAIILKAMATKPKDRYQSVGEFARDIESLLAEEPVSAWDEPWSVRTQRWIKRHRTAVTSAIIGTAITMVALVVGVVLLSAANRQEAIARVDAETAREQVTEVSNLALSQYGEYVKSITNSPRLRTESLEPLRRDLLLAAKDFYVKLATISGDSVFLQAEAADAHFRLGNIESELEDRPAAVEHHRQAIRILEELCGGSAGETDQLRLMIAKNTMNLALNLKILGEHEEADSALQDAEEIASELQQDSLGAVADELLAAVFHNRGSWRYTDGDLAAAEENFLRAEASVRKILQASPSNEEILQLSARTQSNLGLVYSARNRFDEAIERFKSSIEVLTTLNRESPDPYHESEIGRSWRSIADVQHARSDFAAAETAYKEAQRILGDLVQRHPDVASFRYDLAAVSANQSVHFSTRGMMDDALGASEECISTYRQLIEAHGEHARFRRSLATALSNRVQLLLNLKQHANAEAAALESWQIRRALAANTASTNDQSDLATASTLRGRVAMEMDDYPAALEFHQQAEQTLAELVDKDGETPSHRQSLGHCQSSMATILAVLGEDNASTYYERAFETRKKLANAHPSASQYTLEMLASQSNWARYLSRSGRQEKAVDEFDLALAELRRFLVDNPDHEEANAILGGTLVAKASCLCAMEKYEAAKSCFLEGETKGRSLFLDEEIELAQSLAFAGDSQQSAGRLQAVEQRVQDQPFLLAEVAIGYALLSTRSEPPVATVHRQKAIKYLRSLAELGFFSREDNQQRFQKAWRQGVFGESQEFAALRPTMLGEPKDGADE